MLLANGIRKAAMHSPDNSCQNRSIHAEIIFFSDFSILVFARFYWLTGFRGPRCIIVQNFIKINQFVVEILRFFVFFFKVAAVRHFGICLGPWDHPSRILGGLYHCAKCDFDRRNCFDVNVSIFGAFGWKRLSTPPPMGFWRYLTS